ncbi:MAG: ZIP family metal transporter [Proteobacteria bacterium]|nr:ZIP family metal transporter [Pseudomonadota bacterium]MDA1331977.1 ZIP family metal transporter [Pseudomonadota bacterium]
MSTLAWIIGSALIGALLSVGASAWFSYRANPKNIQKLVSYAIGTLLGATFLEVIPHALKTNPDAKLLSAIILGGILGFFVLEKFVLWRHCHFEACEEHDHHTTQTDNGRTGTLVIVGDTFHNFVDGVLIAAAYLTDIRLGIITTIAITAHEIPQEVGDFLILLNSGFSKRKALFWNLLCSVATLVGGLTAYFAFEVVNDLIAPFLGLAAASMIYIAVADLIPSLHKRTDLKATAEQIILILLGVGTIVAADHIAHF